MLRGSEAWHIHDDYLFRAERDMRQCRGSSCPIIFCLFVSVFFERVWLCALFVFWF